MGVTEQGRDIWRRIRAHQPIGATLRKAHMLQPVEVTQQVLPFRRDARFPREVVEMLLNHEGQEGTEHMPTDGGVGGMKDRSRAHDRLRLTKEILDLQQIAIAENGLPRRPFRVGPPHQESSETRLFGELSSVDLERAIVLVLADLA